MLQATVDLLRHVIHRLKLVQKLRAQMAAADGGGESGHPALRPGTPAMRSCCSSYVRQHAGAGPQHAGFAACAAWRHATRDRARQRCRCTCMRRPPCHPRPIAGILEVAKAAKLLSEIAAVDAEADLSGVDVAEADAELLQTAAAVVRSQTEVGGAVQRSRKERFWRLLCRCTCCSGRVHVS